MGYFEDKRKERLGWLQNYMVMVVEDPINKTGLGFVQIIDLYSVRYGLTDKTARDDVEKIMRVLKYDNMKGMIIKQIVKEAKK